MPAELSLYMLTRNSMRTVEAALRSAQFADEIVVVDSGSTDGTLDVAAKCATRVLERDWPGFREQYQFAHDQCSHDWVMFLDADEEVSPELAAEIREALPDAGEGAAAQEIVGFRIPRRTFFIDRWIRHGAWRGDSEIRLCRKDRSSWLGGLHACIHTDGRTLALTRPIDHYTYAGIADQLDTLNRYSSDTVPELLASGRARILAHMLLDPPCRFVKEYFLEAGFLDGVPGLIIAVNNMAYTFNKYAKLWEHRRTSEKGEGV